MTQPAAPDVPELVLGALALACRVEPRAIGRSTRMHDLDVDSLTLVAVLARIEACCGAEFAADDVLALLEARDVGAFIGAIQARLARAGPEHSSSREG
jgi:hypothetical protein